MHQLTISINELGESSAIVRDESSKNQNCQPCVVEGLYQPLDLPLLNGSVREGLALLVFRHGDVVKTKVKIMGISSMTVLLLYRKWWTGEYATAESIRSPLRSLCSTEVCEKGIGIAMDIISADITNQNNTDHLHFWTFFS